MGDLDNILNDSEESTGEAETEQVNEVVEETVEENTEEPTEEPEVEAKKEDSTPEPKEDEKTHWQFEAYKDEKRKRQELERELNELKTPKEPVKVPDVLDDQDAYTSYIQNQVSQSTTNMKANMSQFMAERELGKDVVAQKLETFNSMLKADPSLQSKVLDSVSPYHEMVDIVDKAERLKQFENVDDIEAKIRADVEAEYAAKYSDKEANRTSVTPSLNGRASSSSTKEPDDSLEALLSGR